MLLESEMKWSYWRKEVCCKCGETMLKVLERYVEICIECC